MRPELIALWSAEMRCRQTKHFITGSHFHIMGLSRMSWHVSDEDQDKTPDNTDCPYCNNIKLLPAFNDLRTVYPELAAEWSERITLTARRIIFVHQRIQRCGLVLHAMVNM